MAIRMKILYVDRLPQKQQIGSYMHMKCPALTIVAYPSLDARAYTKCLKCHTDIFVLKCHAYYFYLFWCKTLKNIKSSGFFLPGHRGSPSNYPKICSSPSLGKILLSVDLHSNNFLCPQPNANPPLNNKIYVVTPTEASFLVYYNFMLFVNPSHAGFDSNVMSNIYRMLLLLLKKLGENLPHPPTNNISKNQVMLFFTCFYVLWMLNLLWSIVF